MDVPSATAIAKARGLVCGANGVTGTEVGTVTWDCGPVVANGEGTVGALARFPSGSAKSSGARVVVAANGVGMMVVFDRGLVC